MSDPQITSDYRQTSVSPVLFTFTIEAPTEEALNAKFIELLRAQGYVVEQPRAWEKPIDLCRRLGIAGQTLSRKIRDPKRPHVDAHRSATGRILAIASNSLFDAFCVANKPKDQDP